MFISRLRSNSFRFVLIVIFSILGSEAVIADIVQADDLSSFKVKLESANSDTLVIFDVDDVLLTAEDQILQPNHKEYNNFLANKLQSRVSKRDAENLWGIILLNAHYKLVDSSIIDIIKTIQSKDIKTLALTNILTGSFGKVCSIEDWDINRLENNNIDFKPSWSSIKEKKFTNFNPSEPGRPPVFKSGVLFTSSVSKGEVLKAFLSYVRMKPKKIIFIDDKLKNLESVQKFCINENIEFSGFQYNAVKILDQTVLNTRRAQCQFEILEKKQKWLSDEKADFLVSKNNCDVMEFKEDKDPIKN